jgi:hypothetical protein
VPPRVGNPADPSQRSTGAAETLAWERDGPGPGGRADRVETGTDRPPIAAGRTGRTAVIRRFGTGSGVPVDFDPAATEFGRGRAPERHVEVSPVLAPDLEQWPLGPAELLDLRRRECPAEMRSSATRATTFRYTGSSAS